MDTKLITSVPELLGYLRELRLRGRSLGLVPTMGALHAGHQSLIRRAKQQCDAVIVSIFVNPIQFNSAEDLTRYPQDLQKDAGILGELNVDAAFAPSREDIYPEGFQTIVEPGHLASAFEGGSRPGHFRGVATVVLKLFNLVQADIAYFGQKDFQQVQIIRRMVEDLNLNLRLMICPIVREDDGVALSSRNALLSPEERTAAAVLQRSLRRGEELAHAGESQAQVLLQAMREVVKEEPLVTLDYLALADPAKLEPVEEVAAGTVALIAARVGSVRLIDNLILGPPGTNPEALLQMAFSTHQMIQPGARLPGMEADALSRRISACRQCAAFSAVMIPPREFLAKYLKRDYPDLNKVRVAVIGRDASMNPERYIYKNPDRADAFTKALCKMLGVENLQEFKRSFVLTDAMRCHVQSEHIPEKALSYCANHLREELKLFPHLQVVVTLGKDAFWQFQREILDRPAKAIKPFEQLVKDAGWADEEVQVPPLKSLTVHAIYCNHPTMGYHSTPSIASLLLQSTP
jgi:pantoate--beta-alanine ligase